MTLSLFLAAFLLAASWVQTAGAVLPELERFYSDLKLCPATCHSSNDPSNWTIYHEVRRLDVCNQPVLLDFNLYTTIEDQATDVTIRSCTVGDADAKVNLLLLKQPFFKSQSDHLEQSSAGSAPRLANRADAKYLHCGRYPPSLQQLLKRHTIRYKNSATSMGNAEQHRVERCRGCFGKVMLAKYNETLVGVYLGSSVDNRSAKDLIQRFINKVKEEGVGTRKAIQICRSNSTANEVLGVVADTKGNFSAIQEALKSWRNARCLKNAEKSRNLSPTHIWLSKQKPGIYGHNESVAVGHNHTTRRHIGSHGHPHVGNGHARRHISFKNINARDGGSPSEKVLWETIRVFTGDSCASLAEKCGVSGNDFMDYNSRKSNLCSTLAEGQEVCCSRGTLPDRRPKPGDEGICAWKRVEAGEYCRLIAVTNGLELEDLSKFNQETWGWTGCNNLQAGLRICLSEGRPPMPEQVSNAVCGPTVPGTLPSVTG
ncbi:hypothetical protein C2857_004983 [Epichloe festucae Fl1]|uniref:LysM domain-containing protein n=1 Tax=Epichloe festucae (strain Fl1) TaxID=877507 RepID=A0A7S9PX28_EPIFF|nr:hypothetical protein C2857_004983 [Epichloe festucae Fl1]